MNIILYNSQQLEISIKMQSKGEQNFLSSFTKVNLIQNQHDLIYQIEHNVTRTNYTLLLILISQIHKQTNISQWVSRDTAYKHAKDLKQKCKKYKKVSHDGLINMIEIFLHEENGNLYLASVTQLLEFHVIPQFIANKRHLQPQKIYLLVKELTKGLQALHKAGMVHNNIGYHSVCRTSKNYRWFNYDIGELKVHRHKWLKIEPEVNLFSSPEALRNQAVSPSSDIFSLGVLFLSIMSCTDIKMMNQGRPVSEDIRFPSKQLLQKVQHHQFRLLIKQMLRRHPNDRPSMRQIIVKVQNLSFKNNLPIQELIQEDQYISEIFYLPLLKQELIQYEDDSDDSANLFQNDEKQQLKQLQQNKQFQTPNYKITLSYDLQSKQIYLVAEHNFACKVLDYQIIYQNCHLSPSIKQYFKTTFDLYRDLNKIVARNVSIMGNGAFQFKIEKERLIILKESNLSRSGTKSQMQKKNNNVQKMKNNSNPQKQFFISQPTQAKTQALKSNTNKQSRGSRQDQLFVDFEKIKKQPHQQVKKAKQNYSNSIDNNDKSSHHYSFDNLKCNCPNSHHNTKTYYYTQQFGQNADYPVRGRTFKDTYAVSDRSQYEKQLSDIKQCLQEAISKNGQNNQMVAEIYQNLYVLQFESDNFTGAIKTLQKTLSIYQYLFGKQSGKLFNIYQYLAICHQKTNSYKQALHYYQSYQSLLEKLDKQSKNYKIYEETQTILKYKIAKCYLQLKSYTECLNYLQKIQAVLLNGNKFPIYRQNYFILLDNCVILSRQTHLLQSYLAKLQRFVVRKGLQQRIQCRLLLRLIQEYVNLGIIYQKHEYYYENSFRKMTQLLQRIKNMQDNTFKTQIYGLLLRTIQVRLFSETFVILKRYTAEWLYKNLPQQVQKFRQFGASI